MFSLALSFGLGISGITQKNAGGLRRANRDAGSKLAEIKGTLAIWRGSDKDDF